MTTTAIEPTTAWLLLGAFSVVWVTLGVLWGRKARSLDGYMVAGRNVGFALGAATCVATWITSNTMLLAPQLALEMGVWGMLAYSTASFGLFLFAPMAARIRDLMPNGYTSGEFIRLRYGKPAWAAFLTISLFYSLTWMVSMGMAAGILLEALAGIPYIYGMSIILCVCVLYTLFGGLFAVIGTDFIQSWLILAGIVCLAIAIIVHTPVREVHATIAENRPALLNVFFPAALMALFNNLLFGLGEIFHNNVWWSRAFALGKGVGRRAFAFAGLLWLPVPIVAGFLGLAAPALDINVASADMVGPVVAAHILGTGGAILLFVLVFCSLASSIDSLLAATSDLVTKDIVQQVLAPSATNEQLRRYAGWVVIGIGVVTWALCFRRISTLAQVLFFAGPLVGSAIWPIIAGLYWNKTNPTGALLAMVLGSASGLFAYLEIGWYSGALVGTAVSMVIVIGATWLAPASFDWRRLAGDTTGASNA